MDFYIITESQLLLLCSLQPLPYSIIASQIHSIFCSQNSVIMVYIVLKKNMLHRFLVALKLSQLHDCHVCAMNTNFKQNHSIKKLLVCISHINKTIQPKYFHQCYNDPVLMNICSIPKTLSFLLISITPGRKSSDLFSISPLS